MVKDGREWDKFWEYGDVGITPTRKNLFKRFEALRLLQNAKILDVGCGSGTLAKFWEQRGYYVIGLDISDKSLKISHGKGIKCVKGNAEELPFKNDTFDLVYSDGLLEHFLDPKPIIKEIFRVSKKYVCTIVPRDTLTNLIHNLILRPPKEYKKKDHEWIKIHEEFSNNVECEKIRFGRLPLPPHVLFILCEK